MEEPVITSSLILGQPFIVKAGIVCYINGTGERIGFWKAGECFLRFVLWKYMFCFVFFYLFYLFFFLLFLS